MFPAEPCHQFNSSLAPEFGGDCGELAEQAGTGGRWAVRVGRRARCHTVAPRRWPTGATNATRPAGISSTTAADPRHPTAAWAGQPGGRQISPDQPSRERPTWRTKGDGPSGGKPPGRLLPGPTLTPSKKRMC